VMTIKDGYEVSFKLPPIAVITYLRGPCKKKNQSYPNDECSPGNNLSYEVHQVK
jgi:hypothetical protein